MVVSKEIRYYFEAFDSKGGTRAGEPIKSSPLVPPASCQTSCLAIAIRPHFTATMSTLARLRPLTRLSRPSCSSQPILYRSYATRDPYSDKVPTNDPTPPKPVQNVSDSNALPTDAMGLRDEPMQEMPEESEKQRQMQAPNRAEVWSRSQESRERAMSGPRFEQTMMQFQVRVTTSGEGLGALPRNAGVVFILTDT